MLLLLPLFTYFIKLSSKNPLKIFNQNKHYNKNNLNKDQDGHVINNKIKIKLKTNSKDPKSNRTKKGKVLLKHKVEKLQENNKRLE